MKKELILVIVATLLASVAQLFYKQAAASFPALSWPLLVGFTLYCMAGLLIIVSLKALEMSTVFPVLATTFVWVGLLAQFILGETATLLNWLGILLIVGGVALVGWKR